MFVIITSYLLKGNYFQMIFNFFYIVIQIDSISLILELIIIFKVNLFLKHLIFNQCVVQTEQTSKLLNTILAFAIESLPIIAF